MNNGFFRETDPHVRTIEELGFRIPDGWWSRPWEYQWAYEQITPNVVLADMGVGRHYRPFGDWATYKASKVYAVDASPEVMSVNFKRPVEKVVGDFTEKIEFFDDSSLDELVCISVLEEASDWRKGLMEFYRVLRPLGRAILTFDVHYDESKPQHPRWKGMNLEAFRDTAYNGRWRLDPIELNRPQNLIHHSEFNLCCYHTVLTKL